MNENEFISGEYYWVKHKKFGKFYLTRFYCDDDYFKYGWFDWFGSDEGFSSGEVDVLGKAEIIIPDYIDRSKLE